jgi:hypothetical protein
MRDGLGIDSPRMGPGRPTKVLGKRSVSVELDYSITPGDWDKPLNLWIVASYHAISTNKQTNKQAIVRQFFIRDVGDVVKSEHMIAAYIWWGG